MNGKKNQNQTIDKKKLDSWSREKVKVKKHGQNERDNNNDWVKSL